MNARSLSFFLLGAGLVMLSVPAIAHHGTFVSYDSSNPITMKATVTEFRYTNPHIQLYFDVKDANDKVTNWSAEGPDPAVLVQAGWGKKRTQAALAPGAEITITVAPARNGKPLGTMSNIVLANGDSVCGLGGGRGAENCGGPAASTR